MLLRASRSATQYNTQRARAGAYGQLRQGREERSVARCIAKHTVKPARGGRDAARAQPQVRESEQHLHGRTRAGQARGGAEGAAAELLGTGRLVGWFCGRFVGQQ